MISCRAARRIRLRVAARRCRMRPGALEIGAELHQMLSLLLAQWRRLFRVERGDLSLDAVHACERHIPAALQLAGDQAIGGIDGVVLPARMSSLEARVRQRQLQLPPGGGHLARLGLERLDGRIDAERLQDPQHLDADSLIGPEAAERDASLVPWFTSAPWQ